MAHWCAPFGIANGGPRDKFFGRAATLAQFGQLRPSASYCALPRMRAAQARPSGHFLFGGCIQQKLQPDGKIRPKTQYNFEENSAISWVANLRSERAGRPQKEAKNGLFYWPIFAAYFIGLIRLCCKHVASVVSVGLA
jgi:hypothetical protein